jgi:hypothetical protein
MHTFRIVLTEKLGKRPLGEDRIWETNFRKVNCVDVENEGEGTI